MFSIIMPSLLKSYNGAAKSRVEKFHRAVESVKIQECEDWQLIIIADGCEQTMIEARKHVGKRIRAHLIEKQPMFSGSVRNFGIAHADNEYIVYLDTDDYFGSLHLKKIAESISTHDWIWFDDWIYDPRDKEWKRRRADINRRFKHGTSNICHKKSMNLFWESKGYLHDYHFVSQLKKRSSNYARAEDAMQYYVCHIPNKYDI